MTDKQAINGSDISLRPINDSDMLFLSQLYASTRIEEMAQINWSEEQKKQFLIMQFKAQHSHYIKHYMDASFDIILYKGGAVGRLYVEEWNTELRIVDIALLPKNRNQGIGSYFLKKLMQRCEQVKKNLSIHVERNNPAMTLYLRLGFIKINEYSLYDLMQWTANNYHSELNTSYA